MSEDQLSPEQLKVLESHQNEYDRKLKTFALDVAARIPAAMNAGTEAVISAAELICAYITRSPKKWPIPSHDEAIAELAHKEATGEQP